MIIISQHDSGRIFNMTDDVIKKVRDAEEEGRRLLEAARKEADMYQQSARKQAEADRERALQVARTEAKNHVDSCITDARAEEKRLAAELEKEIKKIVSSGAGRVQEVSGSILEKVLTGEWA